MKILFSLFLMFTASSLSASISSDDYYGLSGSDAVVTDSVTTTRDRTVRRIGSRSTLSERPPTESSPSNYSKIATPLLSPPKKVASAEAVPSVVGTTAIPEPSAIALMGLGLFGLVVLRRKAKS